MTLPSQDRRFRVALSFPNELREYVEMVARRLQTHFGRSQVFYDADHRPELARMELDLHLQKIYRDDADIIVVFHCAEYDEKRWCGLEWRAIRNLIGARTAHFMLVKMDGSPLPPGLFDTDGYLPGNKMTPDEVAADIITRYNQEMAVPELVRGARSHSKAAASVAVPVAHARGLKRKVEMKIKADYDGFTKEDGEDFLELLKDLARRELEVRIVSTSPGCVRLILEADQELAQAILAAASRGFIGPYEVISFRDLTPLHVRLAAPASNVPPPSFLDPRLVDLAAEIIPNAAILVNAVRKRIKQFAAGRIPLVKTSLFKSPANTALEEIILGKIKLVFPGESEEDGLEPYVQNGDLAFSGA